MDNLAKSNLVAMALMSAAVRGIYRGQAGQRSGGLVQTNAIDPADVPPAVTESRQVRRARERAEAKGRVPRS